MTPWKSPVTVGLIAISVAVYALMSLWNYESIVRLLLISQYLSPPLPEIQDGEIWRLVTPMFLHFGIFHIVFNLMWTWQLGQIIEYKQGGLIMLMVSLVSGVVSNLAQYWVSGPVFGGMSGVVYALFGYFWIQGLTNPWFGMRLNPTIVYLMLGWFVICWSGILEKLFNLGIANTAHTAGLASGIVMSLLVSFFYRRRSTPAG